jgi:hypothetical protein
VGHTQGIPCGGKVVGDYRLPDIHFERFDDLVHGRATPGNQQTIRMLDLEERRLGHAVHLLLRDIGDFAPFNIPRTSEIISNPACSRTLRNMSADAS